ncbi:hypothetical protein LV779_34335 [Streptomyces thinghirensis]|nr:hypothetical protein [Streptomyces thinghirensis]
MGEELFEVLTLVARADRLLGYSLRDLCVDDPDRVLNRTEYPARPLRGQRPSTSTRRLRRPPAAVVAGHSLGSTAPCSPRAPSASSPGSTSCANAAS